MREKATDSAEGEQGPNNFCHGHKLEKNLKRTELIRQPLIGLLANPLHDRLRYLFCNQTENI